MLNNSLAQCWRSHGALTRVKTNVTCTLNFRLWSVTQWASTMARSFCVWPIGCVKKVHKCGKGGNCEQRARRVCSFIFVYPKCKSMRHSFGIEYHPVLVCQMPMLWRFCDSICIYMYVYNPGYIQGLAKEWSLGCVKRAPWQEEARTQESRNLGNIL